MARAVPGGQGRLLAQRRGLTRRPSSRGAAPPRPAPAPAGGYKTWGGRVAAAGERAGGRAV